MVYHSLTDIRDRIDRLDRELVALIAQRADCVKAAAAFKSDATAVRAPDRVQQVIDKVRQQAVQTGLPEVIIEKIYRAMIGAFIDYELEQYKALRQPER